MKSNERGFVEWGLMTKIEGKEDHIIYFPTRALARKHLKICKITNQWNKKYKINMFKFTTIHGPLIYNKMSRIVTTVKVY